MPPAAAGRREVSGDTPHPGKGLRPLHPYVRAFGRHPTNTFADYMKPCLKSNTGEMLL